MDSEVNERAVIGGNNPPLVDPDLLAQSAAKVAAFTATAEEWVKLGEIQNADQAGRIVDFIGGAKKVKKVIEMAQAAAKKPHMDKATAAYDAFKPFLLTLSRALDKVTPLAVAWEAKERVRLTAEKERQRAEAESLRIKAEEAAAIARETASIAGEVEADALAKEAAKAAKAAAKPVSVQLKSGSGGGRTMAVRTIRTAEITNIRLLFMHFAEHPDVAETLLRLANQTIRAAGYDPEANPVPGITINNKESLS